jgi:glutamyl-tRNA(Gln) amidotransferase subunit E
MNNDDYYRELGLKCGLEIHQQLDSKEKLFCRCPTALRETEESNVEFHRYLRATESEMGEKDRAAVEQTRVNRKYIYKGYDTTCLIEYDEEPPRKLNSEALDIALVVAKLMNMRPVEQLHVMRKIVVDGSNTTGFQRTAFLANDGMIPTSLNEVGVDVLCIEEEAAQKIEDKKNSIVYSLDRLGIPLVEIGTAPDIMTPAHARETAQIIGMLLRSTGKVKRGLGTIRQDVNISIAEGARVEVKGVQALDMIETIVELEVERQVNLLRLREMLQQRNAGVHNEIFDVTDVFRDTESKVIKRVLKKGKVLAIRLIGFDGIIGEEVQPGRRLGTEFSDRAKPSGVGGIFHTDELPKYGITADEVESLRTSVGAVDGDAVVLVADSYKKAHGAMESVLIRAREALEFVPEETRRALPDGNTAYMRPLPGASRMYPETDVPVIDIYPSYFESIETPELLIDKSKRFTEEYNLNDELAEKIVYSKYLPLFENIMDRFALNDSISATLVARTFTGRLPELRRDGIDVEKLQEEHFIALFDAIGEGKAAKEGIDELLRLLAEKPALSINEALEQLGFSGIDISEIEAFAASLVEERADFVKEKGLGAVGPLMGIVMGQFRGKVDGKVVSDILKQKIEEHINS